MTRKAIILAAGRGARMASYSNNCPKSLLEFKNEQLLSRQLRSFSEAGINKFIIVGGYMIDKMEEFVRKSRHDIQLVYNPFYSHMNSMGSLWFAREYLEGDIFVTNADTYFENSIYSKLLKNKNDFIFGVDKSKINDADYRVTLNEEYILNMGKDIPDNETMAEYIGVALVRSQGVCLFKSLLESVIRNENYNLWWEDLFLELMAKGKKISYVDVTGHLWFEVDEVKDYRKGQQYF